MNVFEAIEQRRSIRSYKPDPVEPDKLEKVLEAGRLAPSASNRQEWRYVVVTDAAAREALSEAANGQRFVAEAPVVIACCAETDGHTMACGQQCYPIDLAISIDHMVLAAWEMGLGTCWVGAFSEDKAKDALGIPAEIRVVELLALGYPVEVPPPKPRKEMAEIVHREKWGGGK